MNNFIKISGAFFIGVLMCLGAISLLQKDEGKYGADLGLATPNMYHSVKANYDNPVTEKFDVDFTKAAEIATPSVVHIKSTIKNTGFTQQWMELPAPFKDFFGDDPFGKRQQPEAQPQIGSGSGVIIREDGYIVTNNHVVADASEIEVTLNNNHSYQAEVIGTDPTTDMALIKIKAKDLPALAIGNSDEVKVGQWVLAVGNPFNLESTVTAGIVSAKGRGIHILDDRAAIESFIQTDAAINPGNSGGALITLNGELIGINTAIASPTGSYSGYGFAVPSNIMIKVVQDLMEHGKVQRAFLGITIREVNSDLAKEKGLKVHEGVFVDSLSQDGAARTAGIRQGDVIVKVDEMVIKTVPELQETIGRHRPGDHVNVTVIRDDHEKTLEVGLKNISGNTAVMEAHRDDILKGFGAEFDELSKSEKENLGLEYGIKVSKLYPGKLQQQTEMRPGFIITNINHEKVRSIDDMVSILKKSDRGVLIQGIYPQDPQDQVYFGFGI